MSALYHGETRGAVSGTFDASEVYLAHGPDLAAEYAGEGGRVLIVECDALNPLVLDTPERFLAAWRESGAETAGDDFHPSRTHAFAQWARAQGYDAVVIPASAFEGDLGFAEVAGRYGEPQTIALDPAIVRVTGTHE